MTAVRFGDRLVGPGHPCLVVAEVGINHNGDLALALAAIDAAAASGADGVKFQNYRTEDFISDRTSTYEYWSPAGPVVEPQYDMFKRCELRPGWLGELREHAARRSLVFLSTPTDVKGIQELVDVDADGVKNGSDYLTNLPLIAAMADSGLPTVLSTGMATVGEVDDAVRTFRAAGGQQLIVLHCTSAYPTPPTEVHLRKMQSLSAVVGCPVGFSDHTKGTAAAAASVALGSCMIEKHFTVDRGLPGPDHHFSADPAELSELVATVRIAEQALGSPVLGPTEIEERSRSEFRLSCAAAAAFPAGHHVAASDIVFRRPGRGIPPKALPWIEGRALARDVEAGEMFTFEHFQ